MHTREMIRAYFAANIAKHLANTDFGRLTELRIRTDKPLIFYRIAPRGPAHALTGGAADGAITEEVLAYRPTFADIAETMERISQYSMYALEEEMRMGFITLPGGHRVGLVGKITAESGRITAIRPVTGLNIRICREVKGCAAPIMPLIMENGLPHNTMLISPPGCGKTTMLRDIVRQISDGTWRQIKSSEASATRAYGTQTAPASPDLFAAKALGRNPAGGLTVGVVDERSEIGGSYRGVPQLDVGIRTDLLDSCPKAEGMMLLLRAMSPKVIAVDELGGAADIGAVEAVSNAGVRLLCTVHGSSVRDIEQKPVLAGLLKMGIFTRFVVMGKPGEAEVFPPHGKREC